MFCNLHGLFSVMTVVLYIGDDHNNDHNDQNDDHDNDHDDDDHL